MFLDDDGLLAQHDTAELCRQAFAADPRLGIISFRIADPDTGVTQRRHVPRLRASDPMRSSRSPPSSAAPTPSARRSSPRSARSRNEFFLRPRGDGPRLAGPRRGLDDRLPVRHGAVPPATTPSRHAVYHRMVARNRVWLGPPQPPRAPRPRPISGCGCCSPSCAAPRARPFRPGSAGSGRAGTTPCGPRRPMKWRTVWRLTRLGRPPVI